MQRADDLAGRPGRRPAAHRRAGRPPGSRAGRSQPEHRDLGVAIVVRPALPERDGLTGPSRWLVSRARSCRDLLGSADRSAGSGTAAARRRNWPGRRRSAFLPGVGVGCRSAAAWLVQAGHDAVAVVDQTSAFSFSRPTRGTKHVGPFQPAPVLPVVLHERAAQPQRLGPAATVASTSPLRTDAPAAPPT